MKKFIIIGEGSYGEPFHRFIYGESESEIYKFAKEIYPKRVSYVDEICEDLFYTKDELKREVDNN